MPDKMEILRLQTASINTWPAKHFFFLNGWIMRFSDDFSNRANSVLPAEYHGSNLIEDIGIVEEAYKEFGKDPKFVIHPHVKPETLEEALIKRGYQKESRILDTLYCTISNYVETAGNQVVKITSSSRGENSWLNFLALNNDRIPEQVINRIKLPSKQCFSAISDGKIVGAVFAVLDRGYLYMANLQVDSKHRRKGIATSLVSRVIRWGRKQGANHAWLHVDSRNNAAITMYKRKGFELVYRYSYYSKSQY